jgi:hypothetical protein
VRVVASGLFCLPRTETWEGGVSAVVIITTTLIVVIVFNSMVLIKMKDILAEDNLRFIIIRLLLLVAVYFVQYGVYLVGTCYEWATGYYMPPGLDIFTGAVTFVCFCALQWFFNTNFCIFNNFYVRWELFWTHLYIFGQVPKFSNLLKK